MKLLKSILAPESVLLIALAVTAIGVLPKSIVPFAYILIGAICLVWLILRTARSHSSLWPQFGVTSGAIFSLVFGICLLLLPDQTLLPLGVALCITFVAGVLWAAWESKSPNQTV